MTVRGNEIDERDDRRGWLRREGAFLAGAAGSVAVAVALFTRFSIEGTLSRDEAVYAYGGQRLAHGVPPYVSIFDTKTPLATFVAGAAARAANVLHVNDLYAIRLTFFACAVLAVLAAYLLAARLWHSVAAGLACAAVLASFGGFAADALAGPDAKTPGVFLALLSMWLLVRRDWFWGAAAGALATWVWQPLGIYPLVAVAAAALVPEAGRRLRAVLAAVAGVALPTILLGGYFLITGSLGALLEAAVRFPLAGIHRVPMTWTERVAHIARVVHGSLHGGAVLFWAGLALLVIGVVVQRVRRGGGVRATLADPLVSVVLVTMVFEIGFATTDFQGYPDLYPLLPYAALGWGAAVGMLQRAVRSTAATGVVAGATVLAVLALTAYSWPALTHHPRNDRGLVPELRAACGVHRLLGPHGMLWALGNPAPLVLLRRANPDRFIYLDSGVDVWKIRHTPGGAAAWEQQIVRANPRVIVMNSWVSPRRIDMAQALRQDGYVSRFVGEWQVFLRPWLEQAAASQGVLLTPQKTRVATRPDGRPLPAAARCGTGLS